MEKFYRIESYLLNSKFRKIGWIFLLFGVPFVLLSFTILLLAFNISNFAELWDSWGIFYLHIPLSIGLYFILFAKEKEEDEYFLSLRLSAMMHGIRFIFIAIILLPVLSYLINSGFNKHILPPDVGGNLAVVTLLLVYANGSYFILKKKAVENE